MIIKNLKQTCFAVPSQWEGTNEDGKYVLIHYRHGYFSISSLDEKGELHELYGKHIGDTMDGLLEEKDMKHICKEKGFIVK